MKTVLVAFLVATTAAPVLARQRTQADELKRTVDELRDAAMTLPSGTSRQRVLTAVRWFQESPLAAKTNPDDVSREYLRSLQVATTVLKQRPSPAALEDVAEDLEAKVEHCQKLRVGMGGTVVVTVRTRRAGADVNDWQVQYLLKFYESVSGAQPATFGRVSSPTITTLEPGRYWIWARDPVSGRTSERVLVRVAGAKEIALDVPVP